MGLSPWDIPNIYNDGFYKRVLLSEGTLGLGESYMDGCWDCKSVRCLLSYYEGQTFIKKSKCRFEVIVDLLATHWFSICR